MHWNRCCSTAAQANPQTSNRPRRTPTASACSFGPSSGLEREAAVEAFGEFLDGTRFSADQINFNLVVNELTANGVMAPARLYEPPYVDSAPHGPDTIFAEAEVDTIVGILRTVRANATPEEGVA